MRRDADRVEGWGEEWAERSVAGWGQECAGVEGPVGAEGLEGLALAVVLALGYLVATPIAAPGTATAGTHVVADGETMWSIAVEHAPAGEAAGYVEQLVAANGGAAVAPGQELVLPTP